MYIYIYYICILYIYTHISKLDHWLISYIDSYLIYTCTLMRLPPQSYKVSIKIKPWRLTKSIAEIKSDTEQKYEIGVAAQSWL